MKTYESSRSLTYSNSALCGTSRGSDFPNFFPPHTADSEPHFSLLCLCITVLKLTGDQPVYEAPSPGLLHLSCRQRGKTQLHFKLYAL